MRVHLVTVGIVLVVAMMATWMKACAEADTAADIARGLSVDDRAVEHAAWLTFSAQQGPPGTAAATELETLAKDSDRGFLGRAGLGAAAFGSGGRPSKALGLDRAQSAQAQKLARGPNGIASALMAVFLIAWLLLAFAWAWRGHDRTGRPAPGRAALAGLCAVSWVGWLAAAAAV